MTSIQDRLSEEEHDEKLTKLSNELKRLLKASRNAMSKYYPKWERNIRVYRGDLEPDQQDLDAQSLGEPEKCIIPLSFAQVHTFVAFGFLLLTQNKNFYELTPTGNEDYPLKELAEKGLARDLRHNRWNTVLYQALLDLARCSIAPLKFWWTVDTQSVKLEEPNSLDPAELPKSVRANYTSYEGNRIQNVKPCQFLPDTRKSLAEWEKGQFVADEDAWHITNVRQLETKKLAFGTKYVKAYDSTTWLARGTSSLALVGESAMSKTSSDTDFMVAVVEGNIWLVPSTYDLGPETEPVLYTFRLANDRLISLEEQGSLHGKFNYVLAQYSNDNEAKLNAGLSDTIHALQNAVSWLYNSRMASVRNTLDRHLVVNPNFIDTAGLEARSPIIYTRKNAPTADVRQFVQQLEVRDTTTGHFNDAENLIRIMHLVTGVNENAMGQFSNGRRSATENRAANAGAASRMKVVISCAWDSAFGPLGQRLLSNQRQGLSLDTFTKIFGSDEKTQNLYQLYCPETPQTLIGTEDFFSLDATLQSEKGWLAQSLQELLTTMISNPEMAMASGFDLQAATEEIQYLRGISNATRLFKPQTPGAAPLGITPELDPAQSGLAQLP